MEDGAEKLTPSSVLYPPSSSSLPARSLGPLLPLTGWPRDRRGLEREWMDAPAAEPVELRRSLAYIRRVNSLLGYHQATLTHLRRFAARWEPRETIRILD